MDSLAKMHGQKKCWNNGLIFHLKTKLKLWIDYLNSKAKQLLKHRLHLPLENKIETMDSLVKMHGQKNCWNNGLIFHLKTKLKLWIDYLNSKAKQLLKHRLDFPFENKFKTMDIMPKM